MKRVCCLNYKSRKDGSHKEDGRQQIVTLTMEIVVSYKTSIHTDTNTHTHCYIHILLKMHDTENEVCISNITAL